MPLLVPNEAYMTSEAFPGMPGKTLTVSSVPFRQMERGRRVLVLRSTTPTLQSDTRVWGVETL